MAVTINDISKAANISKAVISKVLNNKPDVADETRKMVLKIINEMGYIPNKRARELSLGTNRDVALILPSDNIVYLRLLLQLYRHLESEGYNVAFHITDHDPKKESKILHAIQAERLQGVIYFEGPDRDESVQNILENLSIPVVVLGGNGTEKTTFDRVYCDEADMAETLAQMVKARGIPRVACLGMPEEKAYQKKRNQHMQQALADAGLLSKDYTFLTASATSADEGYRMMGCLPDAPSSVCLCSNVFTGGVLRYLQEKNMLSGTGKGQYEIFTLGDTSSFDELGLGYAYVSLPIEALAEKASITLLQRMENRDAKVETWRIPPFASHTLE